MYLNREAARHVLRSAARHASPGRLRTWTGMGGAWMALRTMVGTGRKLDDLLFPEWRSQVVREPVFIFANGRSGTTMLHRLLGLDEDHFAGYKLYQSVFSAVVYQRLFEAVGRAPLLGELGRQGVDKINQTFFSGWEGIHEMGIDKEEEDEATFAFALETPSISLLHPYLEDYAQMGRLDEEPPAVRAAFMDYYEATIQKHLYSVGGDKQLLTKNVFTAPRVRTILERFPDARFLYLVRHPYKALPSWLSLFEEKWVTHSPELRGDAVRHRELAQMSFDYYRIAIARRDELPAERMHVVRYEELVKSPKAIVERVYDWMDLEMSAEYRAAVEEMTSRQRKYKSKHKYSLEQFGLTEDWVAEQIPDVFEAFDYTP